MIWRSLCLPWLPENRNNIYIYLWLERPDFVVFLYCVFVEILSTRRITFVDDGRPSTISRSPSVSSSAAVETRWICPRSVSYWTDFNTLHVVSSHWDILYVAKMLYQYLLQTFSPFQTDFTVLNLYCIKGAILYYSLKNS